MCRVPGLSVVKHGGQVRGRVGNIRFIPPASRCPSAQIVWITAGDCCRLGALETPETSEVTQNGNLLARILERHRRRGTSRTDAGLATWW